MQQVNLYVDSLKPKKVYLSLVHMLLAFVLISLLLVGATFLGQSNMNSWSSKLAAKQQLKEQILQQAKAFEVQVKGLKVDVSLQNLNARLEKRIEANDRLASTIDGAIRIEQGQFSKLMTALARQYLSGVSLSRIKFDKGGLEIALSGQTDAANKVPEYLQRLRKEPLFIGRAFRSFLVENQDGSNALFFNLSTQLEVSQEPLERFLSGSK